MSATINFIFNDIYLSAGIGLLAVSFIGIFWIVRSLRKKQEIESILPGNFNDFFTPPQAQAPMPPLAPMTPPLPQASPQAVFAPPAPAAAPAPVIVAASASASRISLEQVASHLEKIEEQLQAITQKLEAPAAQGSKGAGSPQDAAQISELSSKVEKIYQVLSSLSGSSR